MLLLCVGEFDSYPRDCILKLPRTLRGIQTLLEELKSAPLFHRILKRGDVVDKLTLFRQQLDTAIDTFNVCFMLQ